MNVIIQANTIDSVEGSGRSVKALELAHKLAKSEGLDFDLDNVCLDKMKLIKLLREKNNSIIIYDEISFSGVIG